MQATGSLHAQDALAAARPKKTWGLAARRVPLVQAAAAVTGAAVKFGSLLIDAPFHPDGALAVAVVAAPPAAFAAFLLAKGAAPPR